MNNSVVSMYIKHNLSDLAIFKGMSLDEVKAYQLTTLEKGLVGLSQTELIHRVLDRSIDTYAVSQLFEQIEYANAILHSVHGMFHPHEPSPEPICIIEYLGLSDIHGVCALHVLAEMAAVHHAEQPQTTFNDFFDLEKVKEVRDSMLSHQQNDHAGFVFSDLIFMTTHSGCSASRLRPSHVCGMQEMRAHVNNVFSIICDNLHLLDLNALDNRED